MRDTLTYIIHSDLIFSSCFFQNCFVFFSFFLELCSLIPYGNKFLTFFPFSRFYSIELNECYSICVMYRRVSFCRIRKRRRVVCYSIYRNVSSLYWAKVARFSYIFLETIYLTLKLDTIEA